MYLQSVHLTDLVPPALSCASSAACSVTAARRASPPFSHAAAVRAQQATLSTIAGEAPLLQSEVSTRSTQARERSVTALAERASL
jgi:hypothetical protein